MMEGRPAPGLPEEVVGRGAAWNARQDPLQPRTIELALEAVQTIITRSPVHQRLWRDPAAVTAWMAELTGLARRLESALRARQVRKAAPNAVPLPSTRKPEEVLRAPARRARMRFYALPSDATALLAFAREDTGARLFVLEGDAPRELEAWQLGTVVPPEFAARTDERAHQSGIPVYLWWPEVAPAIALYRERDAGIRELGIASHGYVVPGWGIATLVFAGATEERLLVSDFTCPTGGELRLPRYAGAGPWREVDWPVLRRKVRALRTGMAGPLAGGYADLKELVPVLRDAAVRVRTGSALGGEHLGTTLPFTVKRGR